MNITNNYNSTTIQTIPNAQREIILPDTFANRFLNFENIPSKYINIIFFEILKTMLKNNEKDDLKYLLDKVYSSGKIDYFVEIIFNNKVSSIFNLLEEYSANMLDAIAQHKQKKFFLENIYSQNLIKISASKIKLLFSEEINLKAIVEAFKEKRTCTHSSAESILFKEQSSKDAEWIYEAVKHRNDKSWSNDKCLSLDLFSLNGMLLELASTALKADKEVVLVAVRQNGLAREFASDALKTDKDVVLATVRQKGKLLEFASDALKADKDVVLAAVRQKGKLLEFASDALKNDKNVVLVAVQQNGFALKFASDVLKADKNVILAVVRRDGKLLEFANDALKADKDVVLAAVEKNGLALEFASNALKADKEVVLAAVRQNGLALEFASNALKADKEVVLAAVRQNGFAFFHANCILRSDLEVVTAGLERAPSLVEHMTVAIYTQLRKKNIPLLFRAILGNCHLPPYDREFILDSYRHIREPLSKDKGLFKFLIKRGVKVAYEHRYSYFKYQDVLQVFNVNKKNGIYTPLIKWDKSDKWHDKVSVLKLVQQNGDLLNFASDAVAADKEVVLAAVRQDGTALKFASAALKADKDVVLAAVRQDGTALEFASAALKADKDVVLAAVRQDGTALEFASAALKTDKEVVLAAVRKDGIILKFASDALKADKEVVLAAIRQNGTAINYADKDLVNRDKYISIASVQSQIPYMSVIQLNALVNEFNNDLEETASFVCKSIPNKAKKSISLIWFGTLPDIYLTNLEEQVKNNPQTEITLFVSQGKINHTLSVLNKSVVSETLIKRIAIKSFDKLVLDIINNVEAIATLHKETILKACELYQIYVYGPYHNYAAASDVARLILLAIKPGIYMDMDAWYVDHEAWCKFKASLSRLPRGVLTMPKESNDGGFCNNFIYSNEPYNSNLMHVLNKINAINFRYTLYDKSRLALNFRAKANITMGLTGPDVILYNSTGLECFNQTSIGLSLPAEGHSESDWRSPPSTHNTKAGEAEDIPPATSVFFSNRSTPVALGSHGTPQCQDHFYAKNGTQSFYK